jgi:hypothetical protein
MRGGDDAAAVRRTSSLSQSTAQLLIGNQQFGYYLLKSGVLYLQLSDLVRVATGVYMGVAMATKCWDQECILVPVTIPETGCGLRHVSPPFASCFWPETRRISAFR